MTVVQPFDETIKRTISAKVKQIAKTDEQSNLHKSHNTPREPEIAVTWPAGVGCDKANSTIASVLVAQNAIVDKIITNGISEIVRYHSVFSLYCRSLE